MLIAVYLLVAALLILLNAFFVLAEFAVVKARPTQIAALAEKGNAKARCVALIQANLDVFLSVCQMGITLASIGLGFVGEPAFAALFLPAFLWMGAGLLTDVAAHGAAVTLAYILVSFLHIVLGELIPKSVAIRRTEAAALFIAYPMRFFHAIFALPIWVLNGAVNAILHLCKMPAVPGHASHTEDEIRIILDQSQEGGVMSFRRLLFMENVLDMAGLTARNAMQPRAKAVLLRTDATPDEIRATIARHRYSRYPLTEPGTDMPIGFVHIKDLYLHDGIAPDLRSIARPCLVAADTEPLENILSLMQQKGAHMVLVHAADGRWAGLLTLEDALEEVVGTIEEEYPVETPIRLADYLPQRHVLLDVPGATVIEAAAAALRRLDAAEFPADHELVLERIAARERLGSSYVGKQLALPHARFENLPHPVVVVARLATPIPAPGGKEQIAFLFILLTPAEAPRIHQVLLSRIAGIFMSDFLEGRLRHAATAAELHGVICVAEQSALN